MSKHLPVPQPEEIAARRSEEATPAKRLAAMDAADPSQQRPEKAPCIWDVVDFMAWKTHTDLGITPMRANWPW